MSTDRTSAARWFGAIIAAALLIVALGLYAGHPAVTRLLPWPSPEPAALAFLSSWSAGGAAALLWISVTASFPALRPLLLTLVIAFGGAALELFRHGRSAMPGTEHYVAVALVMSAMAAAGIALLLSLRRLREQQPRPIPRAVPLMCVLAAALLLSGGVSLLIDKDRFFPAPLPRDVSAVCGWFFVGSAFYYISTALKPTRLNSVGQLISFVVYDLLLLPPFVRLLPDVHPAHRAGLFVYLAVLLGTLAVAGWFLLVHPQTRITPVSRRHGSVRTAAP